jgi:hypothetical protein
MSPHTSVFNTLSDSCLNLSKHEYIFYINERKPHGKLARQSFYFTAVLSDASRWIDITVCMRKPRKALNHVKGTSGVCHALQEIDRIWKAFGEG